MKIPHLSHADLWLLSKLEPKWCARNIVLGLARESGGRAHPMAVIKRLARLGFVEVSQPDGESPQPGPRITLASGNYQVRIACRGEEALLEAQRFYADVFG